MRQQTNQDRLPTPTRPRSLEQAEVHSREFQLRATADRTLGNARLQFGGDVDGRHGLESTDTVVSYSASGAVGTTQTTPSIEDAHRTNTGLFTQADVQAARRLRLSGGIRGDVVHSANEGGYFGDREVTNANIAGSAAATFMPVASLTLTGQLSRGFREPMLMDRFYRGPVGRGFIEGNPDLEPESSLQLDVIARYDTGGVTLSSAFYDYRISNLIERYQAGPNSFLFRNRSAARIRGVELEARAALPSRLRPQRHGTVLPRPRRRRWHAARRYRAGVDFTRDAAQPACRELVHPCDGVRLARRRRAERGTDSRLLPGRCRRLLARAADISRSWGRCATC